MRTKEKNSTFLLGLGTLVMMQLKDKLNLSFIADKKGALTKLILRAVLFVAVTAIIVVALSLLNLLSVFTAVSNNLPVPIFNMIFIFMMLLSTVSCIGSLTKSLYFSRDNQSLLSYPVKADTVFLSKLIVYYILSLLREVTFMLPLFLAYGIACGFPFYYFIWAIFMFFIICAVPVSIAAIVSIPWMAISLFFRKRPLAQDIATAALLLAGAVVLFILIDGIPENMHFLIKWNEIYLPEIFKISQNFQKVFIPFFYISAVVTGCNINSIHASGLHTFNSATLPIFAILIGSIALLIALSYLLAKPLFFKMAAKPFEYNSLVYTHDYKSVVKHGKYEPYAFAVRNQKKSNSSFVQKELRNALNNITANGVMKMEYNEEKVLTIIKNNTKLDIEAVSFEDFVNNGETGFIIELRQDEAFLVVAEASTKKRLDCYDPLYLKNQNHHKPSFFSLMWKDVLVYSRTPGTLVKYFLMVLVGPLAIALMNKLFRSINTSFMGDQFVVMFNVLIITMIPLASNVSVASTYSREGESSYLLKASPSNYIYTLTAKLVLRWFLVICSLIATIVVYAHYCDVFFNKPVLLFFAIAFVYTGHLIWCAELDFMNPQDRLYKEVGEGNISNPNENLAGILAFLITFALTGISIYLMLEDVIHVFYKLFAIGIIFLAARVVLAVFRVKGYTTSRGERGNE